MKKFIGATVALTALIAATGGMLGDMPELRSKTSTHGRMMAGARALWRATGMKNEDFGKPIIAVVNSFTQFVPGHVHLKDLGQLVAREIEKADEHRVLLLDSHAYAGPRAATSLFASSETEASPSGTHS